MCGIFFSSDQLEAKIKKKVLSQLTVRGRDEINNLDVHGRTLLHTRLAITGTQNNSSQPYKTGSDNYIFVYNGEIYSIHDKTSDYNKRLADYGDTITIGMMLDELGVKETMLRLNGMFSIVILDVRNEAVLAFRDFFGQKPMFYCLDNQKICIGSTATSLAVTLKSNSLNDKALKSYLNYGFVAPELCIFENISVLSPGAMMHYDLRTHKAEINNNFQDENYYFKDLIDPKKNDLSAVVKHSVKDHLLSDFPISLALSGGVDSTLLAGIINSVSQNKLETFTMRSNSVEEEANATLACKSIGVVPTVITQKTFSKNEIQKIVASLDQPNSDTAIFSSAQIFQSASNNSKVIILGDGGDELFQGYNRHKIANSIFYQFRRVFKIPSFIINLFLSYPMLHQRLMILKNMAESKNIEAFNKNSLLIDRKIGEELHFGKKIGEKPIHEIDQKFYLPGNNLYRVDRVSYLFNIEARAPLLDLRIKHYSDSVDFRNFDNQNKKILKNLRKIFYTDAAFKNKKMGFSRDIKSIFPTGMFSELVIDGLEISDKVDVQFKYLSERRKINLAMLAIWYKDVFQKI